MKNPQTMRTATPWWRGRLARAQWFIALSSLVVVVIALLTQSVTVLFSGIVAISTVVYTSITAKLLKETSLVRAASTEPNVVLYLTLSSQGGFNLVAKNIGAGVAYQCNFDYDNPDDFTTKPGVAPGGFLDAGIPALAPGQSRRLLIGGAPVWDRFKDRCVEVKAHFRNAAGVDFDTTNPIETSSFSGRRLRLEDADYRVEKIANALNGIKSAVEAIRSPQ